MKRMVVIFLLLFFFPSCLFAYKVNKKDQAHLNGIYQKIDHIVSLSPRKILIFSDKIHILKQKYVNNERFYFLLSEIEKYIQNISQGFLVLKVIDGDTVQIYYDEREVSFRLIGIDTPESFVTRFGYKECFGDEASKYLKMMIEGKKVEIEFDETQGKTDKYGRYLAYLFLNGKNINNEMIKNGYAWEYTYNKPYKYQDSFKKSQQLASNNSVGLWSENTCNGERKKITEKSNIQKNPSVGNTNSYFCGNKKYCKNMSSCEEAKFYLQICGLSSLDSDKDGIPCESLCN